MNSTSLENNHIKLNVEKKPGCKVVFSITTLPPATKAAEVAAAKAVAKVVNIPGFRKGRAPEALITSQFKSQIQKEMVDILGRNSFSEAIQLSGIHPLSQNSPARIIKCDPIDNTSYSIMIEFDAYPEIPEVDPSAISITHVEPEPVTEAKIDAHIQELRQHHCSWEEIQDRAAEEGDFVTLKIDLQEDGKTHNVHESNRFHLQEGKMPNWLRKLVIGLNVGETTSGMSQAENGEDEAQFTPRSFIVELKKIERAILPPLDDELAKKAGVENVDRLKEAILRSLEKDAASKARQTMRLAAKRALIEAFPFDLPSEHLKGLLKDSTRRANEEEDPSLTKEQKDLRAQQIFSAGKDNLSFSYLVYKLFADNQLHHPTEAEIRQRATEDMLMRYMRGQQNLTENDMAQFTSIAENELVAEKALDYLIEKSKSA